MLEEWEVEITVKGKIVNRGDLPGDYEWIWREIGDPLDTFIENVGFDKDSVIVASRKVETVA